MSIMCETELSGTPFLFPVFVDFATLHDGHVFPLICEHKVFAWKKWKDRGNK